MEFRIKDLTLRVNMPDSEALLAEVRARLLAGRGFALATVNLDHLVKLRQSVDFRRAYAAQDLIVADGNPIVWLSRLAGKRVSLVPGSDLVAPLAALAVDCGRPVVLLGATEAALNGAEAALGVRAALKIAPVMGYDPDGSEAAAHLGQIAALGPCLVLLALGAPKQERLAARGRDLAPGAGFASVGAGLDFLAGSQRRAPLWMRRLALEWLYRAMGAPGRLLPRYLACAAILPGETIRALRQRR